MTLSGVRCVTRQSSVERLADLDQKLSEYREVVSHVVDVPVVDPVAVLVGECVPETGSLSHPGGDIVGQDSRLAKRPEDGGVRLREFVVASFEDHPADVETGLDGRLELPLDDVACLAVLGVLFERRSSVDWRNQEY